jgi:hypothetical protein
MKNECSKRRPASDPYEVWQGQGFTWKVLKKYQAPDKEAQNPFARWMCAVSSPYNFGGEDLGDVYVREIKSQAVRVA